MSNHFTEDVVTKIIQWLAGHTGYAAQLRRCTSVSDIGLEEAFASARLTFSQANSERFAMALGVLSHLKAACGKVSPGTAMAMGRNKPSVSKLRFQALIRSDDADTVYRQLRRVLPLIQESVDPVQLANDAFWLTSKGGARVRNRWAADYYEKLFDTAGA